MRQGINAPVSLRAGHNVLRAGGKVATFLPPLSSPVPPVKLTPKGVAAPAPRGWDKV